jgi:hypothetical protein
MRASTKQQANAIMGQFGANHGLRSPHQASVTFYEYIYSNTYHSLLFFPGMHLPTPKEAPPACMTRSIRHGIAWLLWHEVDAVCFTRIGCMALLAAICTRHGHGITFLLRHEVDAIWFTQIRHMTPLGAICTRHGITLLLWHGRHPVYPDQSHGS